MGHERILIVEDEKIAGMGIFEVTISKHCAGKGGFTLIELVIIILVLGILAAVVVPKFSDMAKDAADASAKGLLAALRTGNELLYAQSRIADIPPAYTIRDVTTLVDNLHVEHMNDSNHDMKWHVRIAGQEYWYTLSSPQTGMPSVTEWKHDDW